MLNVGLNTAKRARVVNEHGVPELAEAVIQGNLSISAAEQIARLPAEQQEEVMNQSKPEIVQKAKEVRERIDPALQKGTAREFLMCWCS